MPSNNIDAFVITVDPHYTDLRADQFVSDKKECSRSLAAALIKKGFIRINGQTAKPSHKIKAGEIVSGNIPAEPSSHLEPEPIPLNILYEDTCLVIINKPPGLVVHPAPGHASGTLVNGLLSRYPDIRTIGDSTRPGIVHRLDRDTSGAMIVARSPEAFRKLSAMFAARKIVKKYLALIYGTPKEGKGSIRLPIGRHVTNRKKMSVNSGKPRTAETDWRILKRFDDASLLEVTIQTGRTHQIRVHFAASGTPVVGDRTYSAGWTKQAGHFKNKVVFSRVKEASRQMLHAWKLEFIHPERDESVKCTAPLAADMRKLLRDINWLDTDRK